MGTDIHGVVQTRWPDQRWRTAAAIDDDRYYMRFAVLAGLRNYGEVAPIQSERGLPQDFDFDPATGRHRIYDDWSVWMGDHSYGFVALDEVEQWPHWDDVIVERTERTTPRALVGDSFWKWISYLRARFEGQEIRLVFGFDS